MDDSGHRENGRHKPPQGQPFRKKGRISREGYGHSTERFSNSERNNAIMERDNAIATLQYRENAINNSSNISPCPPGCQIGRGVKHMHHPQQNPHHHQSHIVEPQYNTRDMHMNDTIPVSPVAPEPAKSRRAKRPKEPKPSTTPTKRTSKSLKKVKQEGEDLNKTMWKSGPDMGSGSDDLNRQLGGLKQDWKDQDLGLNQVTFDETTMPVPVCSCTGVLRPCYKWGNGGWQSSCCRD
ncbi:hypothetical protein DH2020_034992 [Rehmannia glutinosa]|uniref:GAGA-binding transcriptional activator n=1 Tax=Rehmannia glutinosa TaxID=99300 RepID=A0ABR0VA14_REHGL